MEVLDATSLAERLKWEDKEYWLHLQAAGPLEKYPAKQHARRVQEKLGVEAGLIYLAGQQARNNDDSDMPAPFRQLRYFYYLSGCNEPGCHLTYNIRHDVLALFIPRIDPKRVIWNGRGSTLSEALDRYDVDEVYYVDELEDLIQDWSNQTSNRRSDLFILHRTQVPPGLPKVGPRVDSTSLQPAMNITRMIKDDHEIKLIRKANDISSQAHREVLSNILKYKNEAEVEGLFMNVCISQKAKQQAYDPIAASGPNAGTLHYDANNEDFAGRQLMCLDAGCEFELYASDITRTFPLSASWPTKEAQNIYKLVQRMQEACIEDLAPGVRYLDLHIKAHQIAIDGLLRLGILHNGTREEIYKAGTSKAFFPHGLGHHIGLEVHDVGQAELMSVRRGKPVYEQAPSLDPENFHDPVYDPETCHAPTDPQSSHLEEGMVVTVEPGIYFSLYALQHFYLPSPVHSQYINAEVVERYLPVGGVRIEDDILITSKGYENLTTAPKGDTMLDIIRSGNSTADHTSERRPTSRKSTHKEEPPLLRAPGISSKLPEPILKPLARAQTMPAEYCRRGSADFEPFDGPSLFSNFKRSTTTDENIQRWKQSRENSRAQRSSPASIETPTPVCGESTPNTQHVYMSSLPGTTAVSRAQDKSAEKQVCKECMILVQSLGRLRQNLNSVKQSSPKLNPPVRLGKSELPADARKTSFENISFEKTRLDSRGRHSAEKAATESMPTICERKRPDRQLVHGLYDRLARTPPPPLCFKVKHPRTNSDDKFLATARPPPRRSASTIFSTTGIANPNDFASTQTIPSRVRDDSLECARKEAAKLRLRLSALEDQAFLQARRQERTIRSDRGPSHRASLPTLKLTEKQLQRRWRDHDASVEPVRKTSQSPDQPWERAGTQGAQLERRKQLDRHRHRQSTSSPDSCFCTSPYSECDVSDARDDEESARPRREWLH